MQTYKSGPPPQKKSTISPFICAILYEYEFMNTYSSVVIDYVHLHISGISVSIIRLNDTPLLLQ